MYFFSSATKILLPQKMFTHSLTLISGEKKTNYLPTISKTSGN